MSTRAVQIEILLAGIRDATTGALVSGGTAYFYEAGTTTPKNVWTEKEKTNPYTSYALSAIGTALLYGDGLYKINVLDSAGAQVSGFPRDNIKVRHPNYYSRAVTATTSQTSDDDFLEVNTTSGAVTINLLAAASWVQPIKILHTAGSNAITLEPSGSELIDGAANYSFTSVGSIVEVAANAAGTALIKAGIRSANLDADGDTGIEVERTADVDKIYAKVGGVDKALLTGSADAPDSYIKFNAHRDADGDTFIMVEETADEDKIRMSLAGVAKFLLSATGPQGFIKFNKHSDQDGDTLIEVERTADDDTVYIQTGGVDRIIIDSSALKVAPQSGVTASITSTAVGTTDVSLLAGGYVHTADLADLDSGMVKVRSKDHATIPGTVSLYGTTGTQGTEGLRVLTDGKVNVPVGLQVGGVDFSENTSFSAGGDLTGTIYITRVGKIVTMTWGPLTHSSDYQVASSAGATPSAYRPRTGTTVSSCYRASQTEAALRTVYVDDSGTITFEYVDFAGSWKAETDTGYGTISWVIE